MEKRVFLAVFLCLIVLALYQTYMVPPPPPPVATATPEAGAPATSPQASGAPKTTTAAAPATTGAPLEAAPKAAPTGAKAVISDTAAHDIVVDTKEVRAVFSTAGAVLKSWQLKHHNNFEVVPSDIPDTLPKPFTLGTDDPQMSAFLLLDENVLFALYREFARCESSQ